MQSGSGSGTKLTLDKKAIDDACNTGETFYKLYYESLDNRRHMIGKLYSDEATMIWNGNPYAGQTKIQKFFEELPSSTCTIASMDAHPMNQLAVGGMNSFLIDISGTIKMKERERKQFQQVFVIIQVGDKWKIASDVFRFQGPPSHFT